MNLKLSPNRRRKLLRCKRHTTGSWCFFVPIDKTCGVKLYDTKEMRDATMAGQALAARHGIGPRVGSKVFLGIEETAKLMYRKRKPYQLPRRPVKLYGYVTELVSLRGRRYTWHDWDSKRTT